MRSFSISTLTRYGLLFLTVSTIIYLLSIPPFAVPHLAIFFTFVLFEQHPIRRLFFSLLPLLLFTRLSPSLPLLLLLFIYGLCYFLAHVIYSSRAFDTPVLAVTFSLISHLLISLSVMFITRVFTNVFDLPSFFINLISGTALIIAFMLLFRERIDTTFVRDTWL